MLNTTSLRRYASFAAVVLAGLASIATSVTFHTKDTKEGQDTLGPDALEAAHHFTVSTISPHRMSVEATIDWGSVVDASAAKVVLELAEDGNDEKVSVSRSMLEYVKSSKDEAQAHLLLMLDKRQCEPTACEQGYTMKLRLEGSRPGEEVYVDWVVTGDTEAVGAVDNLFITED